MCAIYSVRIALITVAALWANVVTMISNRYHGYKLVNMDTKPHKLILRAGYTVICGEAHWLYISKSGMFKRKFLQSTVIRKQRSHRKESEKADLDTLREKMIETFWDNNFTVSSETRYTIPRGYYKLPYLMSRSNIPVSLCLKSNTMVIPNTAQLYIFNDSFTVFNFLNNNTNGSTHNAVFNTPLEVGAKGNKPQCHRKMCMVTHS